MVAAATVLLSSCGGSKKAEVAASDSNAEAKTEAKVLEGLPCDANKVMADAKGLLFVTNQFDDATISYATVDVNEDGVNEVIFRCAHTNNTIAAHQDITWVGEDTKWLAWE